MSPAQSSPLTPLAVVLQILCYLQLTTNHSLLMLSHDSFALHGCSDSAGDVNDPLSVMATAFYPRPSRIVAVGGGDCLLFWRG